MTKATKTKMIHFKKMEKFKKMRFFKNVNKF